MEKEQFEYLTGKQVTYQTWELYESMFLASKLKETDFIKLLDLDQIEECSDEVLKLDHEKYVTELKQELEQHAEEIRRLNNLRQTCPSETEVVLIENKIQKEQKTIRRIVSLLS